MQFQMIIHLGGLIMKKRAFFILNGLVCFFLTLLFIETYWSKADAVVLATSSDTVFAVNGCGKVYALDPETVNLKWSYDIGEEVLPSAVVSADGTVYVVSTSGQVYAIAYDTDFEDVSLRWIYDIGGEATSSPVLSTGGNVYISTTDGMIYALAPEYGDETGSYNVAEAISGSPAVLSGSTVCVTSTDGIIVYALDLVDVSEMWEYKDATQSSSIVWLGVSSGSLVYVVRSGGMVHALQLSNGNEKWKHDIQATVSSPPTIGPDNTLYAVSGCTVYALRSSDGAEKWKCDLESEILSSPTVANNTVYVITTNGDVYAISASNGTAKWKHEKDDMLSSLAIGADGTVYVISPGGMVYALDLEDGSKKWNYALSLPLEVCDGKDNDCNGQIDEGLPAKDCSNSCGQGTEICEGGELVCDAPQPQAEVCDGNDNDCDGTIDEDLTRPCSTSCGSGTETCQDGQWISCTAPQPQAEVCDGNDNDCDGTIDEDLTRPCSTACGSGTETCQNGQWASCTALQPQAEVCDGEDNDCNGQVDEGVKTTYYADSDGDGYGNSSLSIQSCSASTGYVTDNNDCDDTDETIHANCGSQSSPQEGILAIEGTNGRIGEEVQITVRIQAAPKPINSFGFFVTYDTTVLEYTGYDRGELTVSCLNFNAVPNVSKNRITIGGMYQTAMLEGASGSLVILKFKVKGGLENQCYPLQLSNVVDDLVGFSQTGGDFCISATCNGDLNEDGNITPADALTAFRCYLGTGFCSDCADVTRDGEVTPSDALCLFKKFLEQPSCLD